MHPPENLLLVFFGMVATGKSFLASSWARQFDLPYYNSDRVRKELAGVTPETGQPSEVDRGIYTPEFSRRTYDGLIERAWSHFVRDSRACVVLDGSYQSLKERELLREHFGGVARLVFVYCYCSEEVIRKRLALRAEDTSAVSDADWKIFLAQKERFERATDMEEVIELDTDAPVDILVAQVNKALVNIR